jgi:hypothetical protein
MRRVLIIALSMLVSATAVAGDDESSRKTAARDLLREGNKLFAENRFDAALARFENAYALYPSPKLSFNIASAHEALGHLVPAADWFERFLRDSGFDSKAKLTREAKARLAKLDTKLARVTIESWSTSARVELDGQNVARPEAIRVMPGKHVLIAQREGYEKLTKELELAAGESKTIALELKPIVAAAPVEPPLPAPTPRAEAPLIVSAPPPADDDSIVEKWWFWAIVVGAAAAVGTSAALIATRKDGFTLDADSGVSSVSDWQRL